MKYETRAIGKRRDIEVACSEWEGWRTPREISDATGLSVDCVRRRILTGAAISEPLRVTRRTPGYRPPGLSEVAEKARAANPFAVLKWHQYPAEAA